MTSDRDSTLLPPRWDESAAEYIRLEPMALPPEFPEADGRDHARWIIYQPATVRPGRQAA